MTSRIFTPRLPIVKFYYYVDRQSGLVVSELDSRSKGCEFKSRLFQNARWKWCQSHAMIDFYTQFWFIIEK
jgi:hypothetical protein